MTRVEAKNLQYKYTTSDLIDKLWDDFEIRLKEKAAKIEKILHKMDKLYEILESFKTQIKEDIKKRERTLKGVSDE